MTEDLKVGDAVRSSLQPGASGRIADIFDLPEVGRRALVDWRQGNQFQSRAWSQFCRPEDLKRAGQRKRTGKERR